MRLSQLKSCFVSFDLFFFKSTAGKANTTVSFLTNDIQMLFETRLSFVENSEHPSRLAAVVLSFWSSTLQHALIHPFTWANEVSASGKLNTQVIRSQVSCPNNGNYVRLR